MYNTTLSSYSGMQFRREENVDRETARDSAARAIRRHRKKGYPVATIQRGKEWELEERDDDVMVPDFCGILHIAHNTYKCRECGSKCDTMDEAIQCCAERDEEPQEEESQVFRNDDRPDQALVAGWLSHIRGDL